MRATNKLAVCKVSPDDVHPVGVVFAAVNKFFMPPFATPHPECQLILDVSMQLLKVVKRDKTGL